MKNPILMFFFFFGSAKKYNKVNLQITFKAPNGEDPSLEEFNEFLDAVSKLHEQIILYTQPEYFNTSPHTNQILDHHKLKIEKLCRRNPFDITLSFQIIREGLTTYWPYLKILIKLCKRYGKNSNDLKNLLENFRQYFNEFYNSNHLENNIELFTIKKELFDKIFKNLKRMITSKVFRYYYDKFCKTTFKMTSVISFVEEINDIKPIEFFDDL